MIAAIVLVGNNGSVIWEFGVGIMAFLLLVAIIIMGIEAIRRFLDAA